MSGGFTRESRRFKTKTVRTVSNQSLVSDKNKQRPNTLINVFRSGFWVGVDGVSRQLVRGDAVLDGAGSDPGDGRGSVRRQGGRLVARHHLYRTR